jgi:hypothetical protein
VPYGFQNGRFNLVQPVRFRDLATTGILQKAGQCAIEGELFHRHTDPQLGALQLIVVGQFAREQTQVASAVEDVLRAHHTEFYTAQQIPGLIELIRKTGRPVADASSR